MSLEENLFETNEHIEILQTWLSANDSIVLDILDRKNYIEKKGEFLEKKEGDNYKLYLPNDLKILELIDIIFYLEQELGLERYKGFEILVEKTKITLGLALKQNQITEDKIKQLVDTYNISKKTLICFQKHKISINKDTKRRIRGLRQIDLEGKERNIEYDLKYRFYTMFFSRGKQMLNNYLNVFTKKDHYNFVNQIEDKNSNKEHWNEKTTEGNVSFIADWNDLYEKEKKIREAIDIEYLKNIVKNINKGNDEWKKKNILISVVNTIINEIYKYPRQIVEGAEKPSHVLKTKEMHCVGKTIIGHIFLEELGIDHTAFIMDTHIALVVNILGEDYYFDAVNYSSLNMIFITDSESFGKSEKLYTGNHRRRLGIKVDPERGIQSSLWTNLGNQLYLDGKGLEGFYCINQALEIFPDNSSAWSTMGLFMENNNPPDMESALNCYEKSLDINPENTESRVGRKNIIEDKKEIMFSEFIINLLEKEYKKAIRKLRKLKVYCIVLGIEKNQEYIKKLINFLKKEKYDEAIKLAVQLRGNFIDEKTLS